MCRNIRPLNNFEPPATSNEVHDAALQYVRKIAGTSKPSKANEEAFHRDLALLNVRPADAYPRASENIDRMLELIGRLVEQGHARLDRLGGMR